MARFHPNRALKLGFCLVLSLLLGLFLGELTLRLYFPMKGLRVTGESTLAQVAGWGPTLSRYGKPLCDGGIPLPRTPGKIRVLLLGDSILDCNESGLPYASSLPGRLARRLGERYEVVNLSASGWGNDQELLAYERLGQEYHPDFVLLFFSPANDLVNNAADRALWDTLPKPRYSLDSRGELKLERSRLAGPEWLAFLDRLELGKRLRRLFLPKRVSSDRHAQLRTFLVPLSAELQQSWKVTQSIFRKLQSDVSAARGKLALVYVPNGILDSCRSDFPFSDKLGCLGYVQGLVPVGCLGGAAVDILQPFRLMKRFSAQSGIPLIDDIDQMPAYQSNPFAITFDCIHLTGKGMQLLVERVVRFLLRY